MKCLILVAVLLALVGSAELEKPAVVRMLEVGVGANGVNPWHMKHHFLGHLFNGSLQVNASKIGAAENDAEEEDKEQVDQTSAVWNVGTLFASDNQDREWQYAVTVNQKKVTGENTEVAAAVRIDEELVFALESVRFFNRQTDTFEEEDQWTLKKLGSKKKKSGGKKNKVGGEQQKRSIEQFPAQERKFSFTQYVNLPTRNGGGVASGTPTIAYGTTADVSNSVDSAPALSIQLSLENSQSNPEMRSLTFIVGTPESLASEVASDEADDEEEGGSRKRRRSGGAGDANEIAESLNARQLLKEKTEVYYLTGSVTKQDQGFWGSPNFMLIMMIGFFGFRTYSSFNDAKKKIKKE